MGLCAAAGRAGGSPGSSALEGWMNWIQFGVQWLHVIFAIFWFGSALYLDFILMPVLRKVPPASARDVGRAVVPRMAMALRIAGTAVIILGIARGYFWGPTKPGTDSFDFASSYGITWSISIILAIVILGIGDGVIGRTAKKLYNDDSLWEFATAGGPPPAGFTALAGRLRMASIVQLVLFVAIFTCMILMRFGY
jgi:uncharacterized membrane protein